MRNITDTELKELAAFAEKATPGRWELADDGELVAVTFTGVKRPRPKYTQVTEVIPSEGGGICTMADAEFMCYANPDRTKRLLEYVWHLEGMLEDQE